MIIAFHHLTPRQQQEAVELDAQENAADTDRYSRPSHERIDACVVDDSTGRVKQLLYYREFMP